MRVSKPFKKHVEHLHNDIYNISLGICSKKWWINKTFPAFTEMVYHFEAFTPIDKFNRKEMEGFSECSLFRVLLHMFLCRRSCDRVESYCWKCSRVRDRNFQNLTVFGDVILEERDIYSKLGINNKQIDFDVFLSYYGTTNCLPYETCEWKQTIQYGGDVFVLFVSILIRVHLNVYYNYFLSIPLSLQDERYFVKKIQILVRELCDKVWTANSNYFFVIFDKFKNLNRSVCYDVDPDKPLKGPYTYPRKDREYYGQLTVVSTCFSER